MKRVDHSVIRWVWVAVLLRSVLHHYHLASVHGLSLGNVVGSTWRRCQKLAARIPPPRTWRSRGDDTCTEEARSNDSSTSLTSPLKYKTPWMPIQEKQQNESLSSEREATATATATTTTTSSSRRLQKLVPAVVAFVKRRVQAVPRWTKQGITHVKGWIPITKLNRSPQSTAKPPSPPPPPPTLSLKRTNKSSRETSSSSGGGGDSVLLRTNTDSSTTAPSQQQQQQQHRKDEIAVLAALRAEEEAIAAAQEQVKGVLARVKEAQAAAAAVAAQAETEATAVTKADTASRTTGTEKVAGHALLTHYAHVQCEQAQAAAVATAIQEAADTIHTTVTELEAVDKDDDDTGRAIAKELEALESLAHSVQEKIQQAEGETESAHTGNGLADIPSVAPPMNLEDVATADTPSIEDIQVVLPESKERYSVQESEDDDYSNNDDDDLDAVYIDEEAMELEPFTDFDGAENEEAEVRESSLGGEHATQPRDTATLSSEPELNTADRGSSSRFRFNGLHERVAPRFSSLLGSFQRNDGLPRSEGRETPVATWDWDFAEEGTDSRPLLEPKYIRARQQPKDPIEEIRLQQKYAAIESLEERAFQILLDLGMLNHE